MFSDSGYKDTDFQDLYIDITKVKKGKSLIKHFPELDEIDEFKMDLSVMNPEREKIIQYIILVYDPNTPLPKSIIERKLEAASLVGWKLKKDTYHKNIIEIFACKNKYVNAMIVAYCVMISPQYSLWASGMEAYEGILKDLIAGNEDVDDPVKASAAKSDLYAKSEAMLDRLNNQKDKMLAKDRAKELEAELYVVRKKLEPLRLRPEHRAKDRVNEN